MLKANLIRSDKRMPILGKNRRKLKTVEKKHVL